ncbi:MAG TPA: sigma 54 modulation/S30EA ribosomal C-terminal domain-containing protein [Micromonosporaceae bacterium]|jgi:ribosome-associated translation inhibitor RaiA
MTRPTITDDLEVVVRGDLPDDIADYARDRIARLGDDIAEPVLHTRIRLTHQPDPGIDRPIRAQANIVLKRRFVRAQVSGRSGPEAVNLLKDRLRERLTRHAPNWEARRGGHPRGQSAAGPAPEPHEWRHDAQPSQRPPYYPRPPEDRQIIRHKSFTPRRISAEEAAWEMDQLDYGFHLFTDEQTAHDAVVFRDSANGYRLQRLTEGPPPAGTDTSITLDPRPAPQLSLDEARERLDLSDARFVFFLDPRTKQGCVLYHRYDGHYGLITPAR